MRRVLVMFCVVAFLAALPLSHLVLAAPAAKVLICHVNSANAVVRQPVPPGPPGTWYFGRMIEVDEDAVEEHLAHGDAQFGGQYPKELTEEKRAAIEAVYGVSLPNANCYFFVAD